MNNSPLIQWKQIPFAREYQISTYGQICRQFKHRTKYYKPYLKRYFQIKRVKYRIIDLVAQTFIGPCPKDHTLIQIGDNTDFSVNNLEYVPTHTLKLHSPTRQELFDIEETLENDTQADIRTIALSLRSTPDKIRKSLRNARNRFDRYVEFPLLIDVLNRTASRDNKIRY